MNNKTALITGACGLLGRQHALALASIGTTVVITDLNPETCERTASELSSEIGKDLFIPVQMDVTNEQSIEKAKREIEDSGRYVDILINNAAIDPKVDSNSKTLEQSRLENYDLESWNFQINVGLTGAFLCSKYFGNSMASRNGGVILNIASDLSVIAPDQRIYRRADREDEQQPVKPVTYSVIKHGLHGLTKYLATYWADKNVRVNSLSPGGVYNNHPEEFLNKLQPLIPMGRMADKKEYWGCVQFLCSDASSYVTGQNVIADGGRSVW